MKTTIVAGGLVLNGGILELDWDRRRLGMETLPTLRCGSC